MSLPRTAITATLPPPIGGWNARDPLDGMAETDAITLVNVFPDTNYCRLRNGYRVHATGMGTGQVKTLHEHVAVDGTRKLVAFANNKIYNATAYNSAATDITAGSAITLDEWSTINFRSSGGSYLLAVNGTDQPRSYDGTTVADLVITHASLSNDNNLIQANSYKRQLYFVEKNTTRVFYMPVDAISGAASGLFDFGGIFRKGGHLVWTASWSRDSGAGLNDMLVACSSNGEILAYQGDNPAATNWLLVGHYFTGRPVGKRSFFFLDSELCIITISGVVPVSQLIGGGDEITFAPSISDKIQFQFNSAAASLLDVFGWEGFVYRGGRALHINVPFSATRFDQYVQNIYTKSWCQYYGVPAITWASLNELPYFGSTDGKIYQFDINQDDNNNFIDIDVKQAFNYFGDRERIKRLDMARPVLQANDNVTFFLDADVDFGAESVDSTATTSGSTGSAWETSDWETTPWGDDSTKQNTNWYNIQGLGRCFALRIKASLRYTAFKWHATSILYEPGGVL